MISNKWIGAALILVFAIPVSAQMPTASGGGIPGGSGQLEGRKQIYGAMNTDIMMMDRPHLKYGSEMMIRRQFVKPSIERMELVKLLLHHAECLDSRSPACEKRMVAVTAASRYNSSQLTKEDSKKAYVDTVLVFKSIRSGEFNQDQLITIGNICDSVGIQTEECVKSFGSTMVEVEMAMGKVTLQPDITPMLPSVLGEEETESTK
jgi:hypothetical protein